MFFTRKIILNFFALFILVVFNNLLQYLHKKSICNNFLRKENSFNNVFNTCLIPSDHPKTELD